MARLARLVVPGLPHHVTQCGNRRQQTFSNDEDCTAYIELMADWCGERGVEVWAYCLMPNHVHLIAIPRSEDGLARAVGEAHRRYTRRINFREKWRGYLWQGRFASFVMDEPYLLAAAQYVELESSAGGFGERCRAVALEQHKVALVGRDDRLVRVAPMLAMIAGWRGFLDSALREEELREHGHTGYPLGNAAFVDRLERVVGRVLHPRGPGRPPKLLKQP